MLVPALTPAALALAELDAIPPDPGEYVRCAACGGPRLKAWAPGVILCTWCRCVMAFLDGRPGEEPRRLRCRRRCKRGEVYLVAGRGSAPALVRCCECHAEDPCAFAVGAYGAIEGPKRLWPRRVPRKKRSRTADPAPPHA